MEARALKDPSLLQFFCIPHLDGYDFTTGGTDRIDFFRTYCHSLMQRAKINEIRCLYEFGAVAFFAYHEHLLLIPIIRQQEVFGFV
jgi:hypothetical protein